MKIKLLSLLVLCALSINAQIFTQIPDSIFEQALIGLGYDNTIDSLVLTSNINTVDSLDVSNLNISDLTGIEGFSTLQYLDCSVNNINTLNLNSNEYLKYLNCSDNSLDVLRIDSLNSLDTLKCSFNNLTDLNTDGNGSLTVLECVSNNIDFLNLDNNTFLGTVRCGHNNLSTLNLSALDLYILQCEYNPIININLANNSSLKHLTCHDNLLQSIDLSDNTNLEWLSIGNGNLMPPTFNNDLTTLDLSNNCNISNFYCSANINLYCIQVCDLSITTNWSQLDAQQYYSTNCNYTAIKEKIPSKEKLVKVRDVFGREVNSIKQNKVLFYIYENNRIEKRITLQ